MSDFKSSEEGFNERIPNPAGIPMQEDDSNKIRKEHNRWKKEIQEIKKDRSIKGLSYWQVVSTSVAL